VNIVRDQIRLEDQAVSIRYQERELGGKKLKLGLIDYPSFYSEGRRGGRSSAADLKRVLGEAREQKVDGIVLDLSSNGGGSLEDAVRSTGLFLKTGNVVKQVTKEDPTGNSNILRDTDPAVDWSGPLVVLVSRVSASASEIVAGTLQDYQRAVVVGSTHTFGKGTVQTVMDIPPNSGDFGAIKITVGRFYIPSGVSTQHDGVSSHIIIPQATDVEEIGEKSLDFSLPPSRIPAFLSSEAFVHEGLGAWTPIRSEWIKTLRERSLARVKANPEFTKIVEERAKTQESGKRIRVAEILSNEKKNDREKARRSRSRSRPTDEREAEYLKRPDIQESLNILVDLIDVKSSAKVARKD
jgi:carboxyl-terminal processing protease